MTLGDLLKKVAKYGKLAGVVWGAYAAIPIMVMAFILSAIAGALHWENVGNVVFWGLTVVAGLQFVIFSVAGFAFGGILATWIKSEETKTDADRLREYSSDLMKEHFRNKR